MRSIMCVVFALFTTVSAFAEIAEGKIEAIDAGAQSITLDDGKNYKLSAEFDFAALEQGMEIYLNFDEINGERIVTDMDIWN